MNTNRLKKIKLSPHFSAYEIFYSKTYNVITLAKDYKLQQVQIYLARKLCKRLLEKIREWAELPIIITGGARNRWVYDRMLLKNPVKPSPRSDHFYMGSAYPLGVGAVDFTIPHINMQKVFDWIRENIDPQHFGQVIWYPEFNFIHISNPRFLLGEVGNIIRIPEHRKILIYKEGEYHQI